MSAWTPAERAYCLWVRAARERKGSAAALGRALEIYLRNSYRLGPESDLRELGVETELTGRTIGRWEKGTSEKPQPQYPSDPWSREALITVVTELVPVEPVERGWASFRDVCEAFAAERLKRIERGAGNLESHASGERNKERHNFLAVNPAPAGQIDPIGLGLGSWAFNGSLPPYVQRTTDRDLAVRLVRPGITTVTGAPKSGKSRSILEVLQRQYPDALTWWVNPSPTVLPLVVENAKKTKGEERPAFIVLDDAALVGTDPTSGLTAQRVSDLAGACTHLIVVIHAQTLAQWEHQISDRTPDNFLSGSIGATRELMDQLSQRVRYASVLDDRETTPAAQTYENADERVQSFDLTRLAETLAGVETLKKQAISLLETPTGVEAALLEAAIDTSMIFPAGADLDILTALMMHHYRQRQPNRPWREHFLDEALDALTTGISTGSPHAILTTTDGDFYRLLDALAPELQHNERDPINTLLATALPDIILIIAIYHAGGWLYEYGDSLKAKRAWTYLAENVDPKTLQLHARPGATTDQPNDVPVDWKLLAKDCFTKAMASLATLAGREGDEAEASAWWERAAKEGLGVAMYVVAETAHMAGDEVAALAWWERAADAGHAYSMFCLGTRAKEAGNGPAAREWWERSAAAGDSDAMVSLGIDAAEAGNTVAALDWWQRAAQAGDRDSMFVLDVLANKTGDEAKAELLKALDG